MIIFGLSGSGKSYLARILSKHFGYEWLRSDAIRKELAGIDINKRAKSPFGEGIYTEDMTERVYREMVSRAKKLLSKGKGVVLDATFLKRYQRDMIRENFKDPLFILAVAEEEEIRRRLSNRKDISDADYSVYLKQKKIMEPPVELDYVAVNTQKSEKELRSILKKLIED